MGLLDPPGFRRNRRGQVWLHLPDSQREVMGDLLEQMLALLDEPESDGPVDPLVDLVGIDPTAQRPDDPALARLFPDAYDDPEAAAEFRRFTQRDLRTAKVANATRARETLDRPDPTRLDDEECQAWLVALNDLRLTLGTRLDIGEDAATYLDLPEDDPTRALYLVYDWLTHHQDRLVRALQKGLR